MANEDKHTYVRTNQPGLRKLLGDQEAEIMEQVWALGGPVLAKDVHARMPNGAKLAYSSVVCTMGRLTTKGLLSVIDGSTKPYRYLPTIAREKFIEQSVHHLLEALNQDFPVAVSNFIQQENAQVSSSLIDTVASLEDED
jgi:predicted transcriptional regulator